MRTQSEKMANGQKGGKIQSCLVIVLHLIGRENGASFLDQSQSKVNKNQSNLGYF